MCRCHKICTNVYPNRKWIITPTLLLYKTSPLILYTTIFCLFMRLRWKMQMGRFWTHMAARFTLLCTYVIAMKPSWNLVIIHHPGALLQEESVMDMADFVIINEGKPRDDKDFEHQKLVGCKWGCKIFQHLVRKWASNFSRGSFYCQKESISENLWVELSA